MSEANLISKVDYDPLVTISQQLAKTVLLRLIDPFTLSLMPHIIDLLFKNDFS